jgi:hypothetical protein
MDWKAIGESSFSQLEAKTWVCMVQCEHPKSILMMSRDLLSSSWFQVYDWLTDLIGVRWGSTNEMGWEREKLILSFCWLGKFVQRELFQHHRRWLRKFLPTKSKNGLIENQDDQARREDCQAINCKCNPESHQIIDQIIVGHSWIRTIPHSD